MSRVWYAEDTLGNEYSGVIVPASEHAPGNRPVPDPCGTRIRQYNADKKREQGAATDEEGEH